MDPRAPNKIIPPLNQLDEFARVNVWVAPAVDVFDDFGGDVWESGGGGGSGASGTCGTSGCAACASFGCED